MNQCFKPTDNAQPPAAAPKVRTVSFEDHAQIMALLAEYGLQTKTYEEWKHLWINNPAYTRFQKSLPIGWVLECEDEQIVGYLGNIPLFYELRGQRLLASVAHAWVVDTRYRGYGLLLLDRYFSQKNIELFVNATVGPAASESFGVFHSLPVPAGTWDRSAFWITNYQGFLASWLTTKAFPLARPLSYVLSVAPFVKQALSKREQWHDPAGVELQVCTDVDGRFDVFWDALRTNNPDVLLGVRTQRSWNGTSNMLSVATRRGL